MKRNWTIGLMVAGAVVLATAGMGLLMEARGQQRSAGITYEYAWLYLPDTGPAVLAQAERQISISNPSERLSTSVETIRQGQYSYRLEFRTVRDDHAAALDIAGQEGFLAIAVVPYKEGVKVLLRR